MGDIQECKPIVAMFFSFSQRSQKSVYLFEISLILSIATNLSFWNCYIGQVK